MGFKCGIVGLPNVGKSTLFNALTQAGIESANYPFCTIEPNHDSHRNCDGISIVFNPKIFNIPLLPEYIQHRFQS